MVLNSFYVDDCLTGSDSVRGAIELQRELHALFAEGKFLLWKWNASEPSLGLQDAQCSISLSDPDEYTKNLGIEWNYTHDQFRLTVADLPWLYQESVGIWYCKNVRCLRLVFANNCEGQDALAIIVVRESELGWSGCWCPTERVATKELPLLSKHIMPRWYYPFTIVSRQLYMASQTHQRRRSCVSGTLP